MEEQTKQDKLSKKLQEIEAKLQNISQDIGINIPSVNKDEINNYLNLSNESLSKMGSGELNYISYKILNYSLYVRQQINLIESIKIYLVGKLREIVSKHILTFKGVSWNYAEQLAINNDEWAVLINNTLTEVNMKLAMYEDIVNILQLFSRKIDSMAFAQRKEAL